MKARLPHPAGLLRQLWVLLWLPLSLAADQLSIPAQRSWSEWSLPGDAVEIVEGAIKPAFMRRDVNAASDAVKFGGGIRGVGTDFLNALHLIDGDPATVWSPDPDAPLEDWWIEVDLGRVVSARAIRLSFAEEGEPLEFFTIFTSDGEPFFTNANIPIPGTVVYQKRYHYGINEKHFTEIDFGLNPLRYLRLQADRKRAGVHLSEVAVETIGDNLALGLLQRGGAIEILSGDLGDKDSNAAVRSGSVSNALIDGNIITNWGDGGAPFYWIEIDLGAVCWVDRVRQLSERSGVQPTDSFNEIYGPPRTRIWNFPWYKLYGSDGARASDGSVRWSFLSELPFDQKNFHEILHFDEQFPLQKLRFLKLLFPYVGFMAEFQIFGEGYPAEVVLRSPIYDLGGAKNVSTVEWVANSPPGTQVEIRTRSGNLVDQKITYRDKNGKEVTQKRWEKLIPSFRGPIDTLRIIGADWSSWSREYETSGQAFLSPVPRRYVQLEARLRSDDPFSAASLQALTLRFQPPLAQETRGEVFPPQALPGEPTDFTYFLKSTLAADNAGFDQILLTSSAGVEFRRLRLDGEEIPAASEKVEGGIKLTLDHPVRRSSLAEIEFQSTLFLDQTRFDASLLNTGLDVRQHVDSGDAVEQVESDRDFVSLPIDDQLIDRIVLSSSVFTPNGDGIGDQLRLEFNLLKLLTPRPVHISIYDLSGRRVWEEEKAGLAGAQASVWDGRDAGGSLVPPGMYILRLEVEGDARGQTSSRLVGVAY